MLGAPSSTWLVELLTLFCTWDSCACGTRGGDAARDAATDDDQCRLDMTARRSCAPRRDSMASCADGASGTRGVSLRQCSHLGGEQTLLALL